jgi:KamA family protein
MIQKSQTALTDEAVVGYRYRTYGLHNFEKIPQIQRLTEEEKFAIKVVGSVLPFKANNYVTEELIDWENYEDDPIFRLTFPHKDMLSAEHFDEMASALKAGLSKTEIKKIANKIRLELNPHPAGQQDLNVPQLGDVKLTGVQHKYRETMLFFPSQGQTCHAYCTFCFRWPQFVGMDELKFAMREIEYVVEYLKEHPEVQDILFTGGDPMIMRTKVLRPYIEALLEADLPNLKTIRIGSKALGYWPYRFTTDADADELLELFQKVTDSGKVLSYMAHFNHPVEMETPAVIEAIKRIRATGAQIRSQSPIMRHINDRAEAWAQMWRKQVDLGIIPYYMFLARDTGAQDYFAVPLARAWRIYREAYQQVSGICRTVRGPSMSAGPGKVQVVGASEINGKKVFTLQFLQGRNPDWVRKPFFAEYDEDAIWLDDLSPAFDDQFFYEEEYREMAEEVVEEA